MESGNKYYEVEKIVNKKKIKRKTYYLVKWLYYPINECTWEPLSNLLNVEFLLKQFEQGYPDTIDEEIYNKFMNKKSIKKVKSNDKNLNKKRKRSQDDKVTQDLSPKELDEKGKDYLDLFKKHLYIKTIKSIPQIREDDKSTNFPSHSINDLNESELAIKAENHGNIEMISLEEINNIKNFRKDIKKLIMPTFA